jgi:hypothetical protein
MPENRAGTIPKIIGNKQSRAWLWRRIMDARKKQEELKWKRRKSELM